MIHLAHGTTIDNMEVNHIINTIVKKTGIGYDLMQAKTRISNITIARHTAMYVIKLNNPNITLKGIGYLFGQRDHSTVLHALQTVEDYYRTNKTYKENLNNICNEINPALIKKIGTLAD